MKFTWAVLLVANLRPPFSAAIEQSQVPFTGTEAPDVHRIAIIGAGAAGSSAAYHLRRFNNLLDHRVPLNITIYESNDRVGGRTTTVNALNDPRYPTELGASIFVKVNHILLNATRDFGLEVKTKISSPTVKGGDVLGVWDGINFVFKQADDEGSSWKGWWDIARLLWRYGISPIRTQQTMRSTVEKFLKFYEEPIFPFCSLQEATEEVGLLDFTGVSGQQALENAGVSEQFSRDIIQASTRVNYGQNLGSIHGLETMVCMAIEGAMAVEGGNWQIFNEAVKHSHAQLHLNTTVTGIERTSKDTYLVHTDSSSSLEVLGPEFDTVILASPYQFSNITFSPRLAKPPPSIPYVSLYVTLFTTPHLLSPTFFSLASTDAVPSTILTTLPPNLNHNLSSSRGMEGVGPTEFWSISTLRNIPADPATPDEQQQYLYKIFSPAPLTGTFLSRLFDLGYTNSTVSDPVASIPKHQVTWIYEKKWHSYPYLPPTTDFETSFRLDKSSSSKKVGGLWYTSIIEHFISTMETSALAGMNVARLILDEASRDAPWKVENLH